MTGTPILLVAFLAAFIYALTKSQTKWKTALMILGTMTVILGIAYGMSFFVLSPAAMGTLAGVVIPITGIAASLILAKRQPPSKPMV